MYQSSVTRIYWIARYYTYRNIFPQTLLERQTLHAPLVPRRTYYTLLRQQTAANCSTKTTTIERHAHKSKTKTKTNQVGAHQNASHTNAQPASQSVRQPQSAIVSQSTSRPVDQSGTHDTTEPREKDHQRLQTRFIGTNTVHMYKLTQTQSSTSSSVHADCSVKRPARDPGVASIDTANRRSSISSWTVGRAARGSRSRCAGSAAPTRRRHTEFVPCSSWIARSIGRSQTRSLD